MFLVSNATDSNDFVLHTVDVTPDAFITCESKISWQSIRASIYGCCFFTNRYTQNLFDKHHIFFPHVMEKAVVKRRAEFFAGRYCAQQSLLLLTGNAHTIHIGPHRNPLWPPNIVGAISHSNTHAIAVTALQLHARGIGIDLQEAIDFDTYTSIKSHIVCADEWKLIQGYDALSVQLKIFSLIFSVKESFFKAAFTEVGNYFDFSCISVIAIDQTEQCIHIKINQTLSKILTEGLVLRAHYQCLPKNTYLTLVMLCP